MSYTPPTGPATSSTRGILKLTNDLGGTADLPTVPVAARVSGGGLETVSTNAAATGAVTLNLANGNVFNVTMIGNTTFTFSGATAGKACAFTLYLRQDSTGGRVATWPNSTILKWSGGAPSLTTTAGAIDVLVFETLDGGTTWFGSLVGTNFA